MEYRDIKAKRTRRCAGWKTGQTNYSS